MQSNPFPVVARAVVIMGAAASAVAIRYPDRRPQPWGNAGAEIHNSRVSTDFGLPNTDCNFGIRDNPTRDLPSLLTANGVKQR